LEEETTETNRPGQRVQWDLDDVEVIDDTRDVPDPLEPPVPIWSPVDIIKMLTGTYKPPATQASAPVPRRSARARRCAFAGDPKHLELIRRIEDLEALRQTYRRARVRDPQIAIRDALIWQMKHDPLLQEQLGQRRNKEIAARLTEAQLRPPERWGVKTFNDAYRNLKIRKLLNKMISAAKPG
jgi:hypothetical protein